MSAALHLAGPEDLDRLLPMVAEFHATLDIASDEEARRAALAPLLEGIPHGAAYLIGPRRAPIGYLIVSFGWSVEFGGLDGFLDEFFIRKALRGRGIGTEAVSSLARTLAAHGLKALHLEAARDDVAVQRLYARLGFDLRDGYCLMSRQF